MVTRALVAEGDSITADAQSYFYDFLPNANPALLSSSNRAVNGSTITDLIGRAAALDAILPLANINILSVFVGANDFNAYGSDPTGYASTLARYCDARRGAGWKLILCTLLPQHSQILFNPFRNSVNTIIKGWRLGLYYDGLSDFGSDPVMGEDNSFIDHPSDWTDDVHPSAAGHTLLEPIYRAAVNNLVVKAYINFVL